MDKVSPRRRREVVDALRRGTVPSHGLDLLAVGLDRFRAALDAGCDDLRACATAQCCPIPFETSAVHPGSAHAPSTAAGGPS